MDIQQSIDALEGEWDVGGFLWELRQGQFSQGRAAEFVALLERISMPEQVPKRFVSLIWMLPGLLAWQCERVAEQGGDVGAYARFVTQVENALEAT